MSAASRLQKVSKIAACCIGDEILSGRTLDTNSNYLAKKCFEHGLNLTQIRIIPDDCEDIVKTIRELSAQNSLVFTSGGVGPTHDDITYESIGQAFSALPLVPHAETIERMKSYYKEAELNAGQLRMATIPLGSEVLFTPNLWVPLVRVRNVLILPGVPRLFAQILDNWFHTQLPKTESLVTAPKMRISIKTLWRESDLEGALRHFQDQVRPFGIAIGSYPKLLEDGSSFVIICVSGSCAAEGEIRKISKDIEVAFQGQVQ